MTSLELFQKQAKDSLLSSELEEATLDTLRHLWGGAEDETLDALAGRALTPEQLPTLLQSAVRRLPDLEVTAQLLQRWESDANLQDDWIEIASGRQLQQAKAHYIQVNRALEADPEHDPATARTWSRILSKLSKALLTHPDNAQGQCDIYGYFKADTFVRAGKLDLTFKGQHLVDGHNAAIKVLKPELTANLPLVYAFVAGSEALAELRHPGIAGVLQSAKRPRAFGDKAFVVTEWRGDATLDDLIATLSPLQRLQCAVEITQALAWLHVNERVHGNLSPGNVIFGEDGAVCLTGFLAPSPDLPPGAWGQLAMALGNPYYIAPELASGALPSAASDLFALGRVLFRLLTGKEENLYDVMVPQLYAQALQASLGDYPDLILILQQTTDLQPASRPASARDVLVQLHRHGGLLGRWQHPELDALAADGAWGPLADTAVVVAQQAEPEQGLHLLQRVAELQEYVLEDRQAALAAWAAIYRTNAAGRALAMDALERLRRDLGDALSAQSVADAFADAAEQGAGDDPAEALELHLRAARLYQRDVGDLSRATHHFRAALDLQPHNDEAFQALDALFTQQLDWGSLVLLLQDRVPSLPAARDKIALLFRIARVEEDSRWNAAAAAAAYAAALELNPSHPSAFQNLNRLLREIGRWEELVDLLEDRAARAEDPAAQLKLQLELARVHHAHRAEHDTAVNLYRDILAAHPEHADAVADLEALLQQLPHTGAAELLEPLYRERGDQRRLVGALEVLLNSREHASAPWADTLREIADLHHLLDDRPEAIAAYQRVLAFEPLDADALRCLDTLFEAEQRWADLVQHLTHRATIHADREDLPAAATDLHRAARLLEANLEQPAEAIATWQRVLDLLPDDADALEQLERLAGDDDLLPQVAAVLDALYQSAEKWEPLAALLVRQLQVDPALQPTQPRADTAARLALIAEQHLDNPQRAWDHARDALATDPRREDLRANLERLTTLTERFEDAAHLYAQLLDADDLSDDLQLHLLDTAGTWLQHHVDAPESAVRCFQRALTLDPDHDVALDALDALYGSLNRYAERADTLQRKAERALQLDQAPQRADLLLQLADLAEHHLQDDPRAIDALRTTAGEQPTDPRPLDALIAIFQRLLRFEDLAQTLDLRARAEDDPERRVALLTDLGDLALDQLHDVHAALDAWERAADLEPAQPLPILQRLLRVHTDRGDVPAFFRWVHPVLQHLRDKEHLLQLHLQAAQLAEHPDAPDDASPDHHFEAVLQLQPYHPLALDSLEAHYQRDKRWDRLDDILRRRFVSLHLKAAHLALHGLQSPPRALEHLLQARALDPHRVEVLDRLIELYELTGEQARLQELIDLRLDLVDDQPDEKAQLLLKRALSFLEGNEEIKALDALTRSLLLRPAQDPEHLLTFARLALPHQRFDELAPQVLGALRTQPNDPTWAALVPALDTATRASAAFADARPDDALLNLHDLAAAPTLLPDLVLDLLLLVFQHHDAEDRFARDLTALAAQRPNDPAWNDAILTRSAELAEAQGDQDAALDAFTSLFHANPANARARQHMLRLAQALQQPERALQAIDQRLQQGISDDALAADLHLGLAAHFDRPDADADELREAVRHYRDALDRRPNHPATLGALARLLRGLQDHGALTDVLDATLHTLDDDARRAAVLLELAHLHRNHHQRPEHAARLTIDLLQSDLDAEDPHRAQARELLLELLQDDLLDRDLKLRALHTLQRAFANLHDHARVFELLNLNLELLDPDDRDAHTRLLLQLAATADLLGLEDDALRFRLQHLRLQPADPELRAALRALAVPEHEHLPAVAQVWSDLVRDPHLATDDRLDLAFEAAAWLDQHLQQPDDAVALLQYALDLRPDAEATLDALQALLQRLQRFDDLVELLLHRAERALDPDQRRALTLQAASVAEDDLQQPDRAEAAYLLLLDSFGPDADVLSRLEAIHERSDNPAGQLRVLQARIELAHNDAPEDAPDLLLKAALLASGPLDDLHAAIDLYEQLRDLDPTHTEALAALGGLYERAERWNDLLIATEQRALLTEDPQERFDLTLTTARIAADHLNDLDTAIACLRDAHALQPDNAPVAQRLYAILERDQRWNDLLAVLQEDLDATHEPQEQVPLCLRIAQIALDPDKLNDLALGKSHLQYVLQVNPNDRQAILQLLDLDLHTQDWRDAVATLERLLAITPEPADQIPLLLQQGDLLQQHLQDTEGAINALLRAWDLDEDGASGARARLIDLYASLQHWDAIIQIVQLDIERCTDVAEQVALELQLADLIRERANNPGFLLQILERAWSRQPEPPLALDILLQIIEAWSSAGALAQAGEWVQRGFELAEQLGAKDKLALLWFHKGRVDSASGLIDAAIHAHQECYKLDGRRLDNILVLGHLLYENQKWDDALKALQVALLKQNELADPERLDMYYLMGMIRYETGDPRRAKDMFRRALSVDKTHAPSLAMIEHLG